MAQNNDKKTNDLVDPAQGAATWKERYELAVSNQTRMFKRWADYYDALYAQIDRTPAPWRSKIYIPKLAQQTWALVAKFLALDPGFIAEVRDSDLDDEKIAERTEKAEQKLEYDYNNRLFDETAREKLFSSLLDAVVVGTGYAKVPWTTEDRVIHDRTDETDGEIDLKKHKVKTVKEGYNNLIPVNCFNLFVSPATANTSGSLYKAPWLIIKEYKPISELEKANKKEAAIIYHHLDKLNGKVTYDTFAQYNRARDRMLTNADPQDKTIRMAELFECYEGDTITTYALGGAGETTGEEGGWIEIRKQKNPYWHGKYPLVKFHVKKRPFNFFGEGIFDITYRLQAGYNDAVNHYFDAWNTSVDPMLLTPESANVDDYVIQPAGLVTYSGTVAPQPFKMAAPDPAMLETATALLDQAIEGVTISQYAAGLPTDETDKTKGTAAGIQSLQEAAGDTVSFMRDNFMQSLIQIGRMWHSNNQQFMLRDLKLTINTPKGPTKTTIKPKDLQGDYIISIDPATMQPMNQQQKIAQFTAYTEQLLALQKASFDQFTALGSLPVAMDFAKLGNDLSQQFEVNNFSKVLIPQEEVEKLHNQQLQMAAQHVQAAQQQQMAMEQAKHTPEPKSLSEMLNMSLNQLPENYQQLALQQIFGVALPYEPSPVEKQNLTKAVDSVSKVAQVNHGVDQDNFNRAHDVIKHASDMHQQNVANALQLAQQDQSAQSQQQMAQSPQSQQAAGVGANQQGGVDGE